MENNSALEEIAKYLRQLASIEVIKLLHSDDVKSKSNAEKIVLLSKMGFEVDDIALFIGTTSGTVRKELSVNKTKNKSG